MTEIFISKLKQVNSESGLHNWKHSWKMTLIHSSFAEDTGGKSCDMAPENKHTREKRFSRWFSPYTTILWKSMPSIIQIKGGKFTLLTQTDGFWEL